MRDATLPAGFSPTQRKSIAVCMAMGPAIDIRLRAVICLAEGDVRCLLGRPPTSEKCGSGDRGPSRPFLSLVETHSCSPASPNHEALGSRTEVAAAAAGEASTFLGAARSWTV